MKPLMACLWCKSAAGADGGILHKAGCEGLNDAKVNVLQVYLLKAEIASLGNEVSFLNEQLHRHGVYIDYLESSSQRGRGH